MAWRMAAKGSADGGAGEAFVGIWGTRILADDFLADCIGGREGHKGRPGDRTGSHGFTRFFLVRMAGSATSGEPGVTVTAFGRTGREFHLTLPTQPAQDEALLEIRRGGCNRLGSSCHIVRTTPIGKRAGYDNPLSGLAVSLVLYSRNYRTAACHLPNTQRTVIDALAERP